MVKKEILTYKKMQKFIKRMRRNAIKPLVVDGFEYYLLTPEGVSGLEKKINPSLLRRIRK